jgi:hypothetical protein
MRLRHGLLRLALLAALALPIACGEDAAEPDDRTVWVVEVSGEEFRIRVADVAARAGIEERLRSQKRGVINGTLVAGDGGFNAPWSWHLDPATVHAAEAAIELCDGRPSMVEADRAYWLGTVRSFCPWGARVARRES